MRSRVAGAIAAMTLGIVIDGCGGPPTTATSAPMNTATIESIVTSYHGAIVESTPVIIPPPEVLDVDTRLTLQGVPDSRVTLYLCVTETSTAIGVGNCIGVGATIAEWQQRGNAVKLGISTLKTDGVARTTTFVYVGIVEGAFPWVPAGRPPQTGEMAGTGRVLATMQLPRTVTFK